MLRSWNTPWLFPCLLWYHICCRVIKIELVTRCIHAIFRRLWYLVIIPSIRLHDSLVRLTQSIALSGSYTGTLSSAWVASLRTRFIGRANFLQLIDVWLQITVCIIPMLAIVTIASRLIRWVLQIRLAIGDSITARPRFVLARRTILHFYSS